MELRLSFTQYIANILQMLACPTASLTLMLIDAVVISIEFGKGLYGLNALEVKEIGAFLRSKSSTGGGSDSFQGVYPDTEEGRSPNGARRRGSPMNDKSSESFAKRSTPFRISDVRSPPLQ